MNIDIFIPARLNSKRLPKKHLEIINGTPMIENLINRLSQTKKIRKIIVCTTNQDSDNELVQFLEKKDILYFRGSEKDILRRFARAAKKFKTDVIIDVEGDKIYTDPKFVDKIAVIMEGDEHYDFVIGNDSKTIFNPNNHFVHGIIPTAIRVSSLKNMIRTNLPKNIETGYKEIFVKNPNIKKKFLIMKSKLDIPQDLRLTVDYPNDIKFARLVFEKLDNNFTHRNILSIIKDNPRLLKIIERTNKIWERNYKLETKNFKYIIKSRL